ncbi:MAG TPA: hypothetical protein VM915_07595, partial [Verrucomicrobiae bacterium]|nr:hypothetical protein [Verrucomicrobiae bacterium]
MTVREPHVALSSTAPVRGAETWAETLNAGGGVMERLSTRTGVAEVLAIVCLISIVVVGAT